MDQLSLSQLQQMLISAANRIEREKDQINKINVFPVPDQDTGGNLSATLKGVRDAINEKTFESLGDFTNVALDGALSAARGNCGVIFTGFLAGFLPALTVDSAKAIKPAVFATSFKEGAKNACQSVQSPKEGTILDVITAVADAMESTLEKSSSSSFDDIFEAGLSQARIALAATTEKMEVLKKAGVVDAGALGFTMIIESFYAIIKREQTKTMEEAAPQKETPGKKLYQFISQRYEVVFLAELTSSSRAEIEDKLRIMGDSLEVLQIKNRIKVHIHTNDPEGVRRVAFASGRVLDIKTSDMAKQLQTGKEEIVSTPTIGIVADEMCDFTQEMIDQYKIRIIPLKFFWPEGKDIKGDNLYEKMIEAKKQGIATPPKSSQPSPKDYFDAFKEELTKYEKVICITLSSGISGAYNSANQAQMMIRDSFLSIFVFDSLLCTGGEGLLVLRALDLIAQQEEVSDIISKLKEYREKVRVYCFVEDPQWMVWGGRLTPSKGAWVRRFQKLGARPLIGLKGGTVEKIGMRFFNKDKVSALAKEIIEKSQKTRGDGQKIRVAITHCNDPKSAQRLKEIIEKSLGDQVIISYINIVSPVLGVHVGPGGLLACWAPIE